MKLQAFPLPSVRLLDSPCKDTQEANRRYLHDLDPERLLWTFRTNAGLPAPGNPLGGWEKPDCEVRGHFVGHYLSACAQMYAAVGDEELKARGDYMVSELAKCQAALGGQYLSAYPESFWDRLETMQNPPWAPYYTMHKIMAGLYDQYVLCGNAQALRVLRGMADYVKVRRDRLSTWEWDRLLGVEFGGMAEVLYDLYAATEVAEYVGLAHDFDRASFLGPLALEHDHLSRIHANTHIPEVVGAARRYELLGDARYRTAVTFFWDRVVNERTYATGGSSNAEHWPDPGKLADTLSSSNQESCTSYNMLKLTRHLIEWTGDARYGDYYERTFFNSILGTQRPQDGMLAYFTPLACGLKRTYGTPDDSFWCCYGTGIESFSIQGLGIYFHDDEGVYVNLFIASRLDWPEKGFSLEQRTRFPYEPKTQLVVHAGQPVVAALNIRVPSWAGEYFAVRINGEMVAVEAKPGSYAVLRRTWKEGDSVELDLPMQLRTESLPDDSETAAVLCGPLVLAGLTDRPVHFLAKGQEISAWLKPVEGQPLTFRTGGQAQDLTFIPLNRIADEPYGVYFVITSEGSPRHQRLLAEEEVRRRWEARIVDHVVPLDEAAEAAHNLQGENTQAGSFRDKAWRHAPDGWFSWDLKVSPDEPAVLACLYWGDDVPPRTFDILVDGTVVATQTLDRNQPNEFFRIEYPLPAELTQGKSKVTVKFAAHPGHTAGGVFECAILKPDIQSSP